MAVLAAFLWIITANVRYTPEELCMGGVRGPLAAARLLLIAVYGAFVLAIPLL